jgi:hypothetical protein
MKIILDLDATTYKKLQVLAQLRSTEPAHLGADLLVQLLSKQMAATEEQVANTADIAEVLASRMMAHDPSGDTVKHALSELQMLDNTAHCRLVMARLMQALKNAGIPDKGSRIYKSL